MTHHLQFLAQFAQEFQGFEETIDLSAQRHAKIEVKDIIETIGSIPDNRTGIGIPLLSYLAGVHAVIHRDVGRQVEVLKDIECRLYGNRVHHTVAPILDQVLVQELILLGCQRILEFTRVAHLDFLIPFFIAHCTFTLERSRLAHGDGDVGERNRKG